MTWSMVAAVHELRLFFVALQFLTRLPVPAWVGHEPAWLNQAVRHFAGVGALVGVAGASVAWCAQLVWPPMVAATLAVAATLWLTAAFHEDGLADTFDALLGAAARERALEIMKDSRIGSYGTLALIVVLGLKATALASLPLGWAAATLLVAHTLSRAVAVTLIRVLPYAGDVEHAKAKPLATRVSAASWCVACAWPLALVALLIGARRGDVAYALPGAAAWLVALAAAVTAGAFCARWFHRRLGGVTGDTLGAAQQLSELAVYLAVLAMLGQ